MSTKISAADVKELRNRTGAGVMDAKSALEEAGGDFDKAAEILRVKGQASAAKRSGRGTSEGVVATYIHGNRKVGAMVEVQCETDFVARGDDFIEFANEVAMHIAAMSPQVVAVDDLPEEQVANERRLFLEKAREDGKPEDVLERIVEGQIKKWSAEVALLEQEHVNGEKHDGQTIEEMREALAAKVGENVVISRFACFRVGE